MVGISGTNWKKIDKRVGPEGRTIVYEWVEYPVIRIESCLRHIPHANGSGTWDHTSYVVLQDGAEVVEKQSLSEAQAYAIRMVRE